VKQKNTALITKAVFFYSVKGKG